MPNAEIMPSADDAANNGDNIHVDTSRQVVRILYKFEPIDSLIKAPTCPRRCNDIVTNNTIVTNPTRKYLHDPIAPINTSRLTISSP